MRIVLKCVFAHDTLTEFDYPEKNVSLNEACRRMQKLYLSEEGA